MVEWTFEEIEQYGRFMEMRSPTQALNVIAEIIHTQAPIEEQDAWLKACIKLEFVEIDSGEEE